VKLLFDENISCRIKNKLQKSFPNCVHITDVSNKLLSDTFIWKYAKNNNFIIVTFDEDFSDIQMLKGFPPKIIWLRCGNKTTNVLVEKLIMFKNKIMDFYIDKEQGILEIY